MGPAAITDRSIWLAIGIALRVCAVEPRGNGAVKAQQEQLRSLRALIDGENEVRHLR